jgi:hypothetical protein
MKYKETVKTVVIAVLITAILVGITGFVAGNRYATNQNTKILNTAKTLK